jgi:hypothetical protein
MAMQKRETRSEPDNCKLIHDCVVNAEGHQIRFQPATSSDGSNWGFTIDISKSPISSVERTGISISVGCEPAANGFELCIALKDDDGHTLETMEDPVQQKNPGDFAIMKQLLLVASYLKQND